MAFSRISCTALTTRFASLRLSFHSEMAALVVIALSSVALSADAFCEGRGASRTELTSALNSLEKVETEV